MAATTEGRLRWPAGETWYRFSGRLDPEAAQVPVVVLHGGPGAAHDYCEPISDLLASTGRAVVLYDQIGCGLSQHLPDAPPGFWTPQLFMDELTALLQHLGIGSRYALVGQSWGGMLGMQYAIGRPPGLAALVAADAPASMRLWVAEADRLRTHLPPDVQEALNRHEAAGTTDSAEYEAAVQVFYDRHLCRIPPPDCVTRSFAQITAEPTVYRTMNGPSEFHVVGSLKDWDITDRLPAIEVPTLLVSGVHDEATPTIVGEIHARVPGSRWELFEHSSHMPHVEEPARFKEVVHGFLAEVADHATP